MCNCIKKLSTQILKQAKEKISQTENILQWDILSGFANQDLFTERLVLPFEIEYISTKKNVAIKTNGPSSKRKTYKTNMFGNFCPFCGEKYIDKKLKSVGNG